MHVLYAACARDEKKFFFAEIIELNRSFWKQFEYCKSDENWAQLLVLKLYMLKLFATQYFDVLANVQIKKISKLTKNIKNIKFCCVAKSFNNCITSKRVSELSFHLICKIQTAFKSYDLALQFSFKNFFFITRACCI